MSESKFWRISKIIFILKVSSENIEQLKSLRILQYSHLGTTTCKWWLLFVMKHTFSLRVKNRNPPAANFLPWATHWRAIFSLSSKLCGAKFSKNITLVDFYPKPPYNDRNVHTSGYASHFQSSISFTFRVISKNVIFH